MLLLFNKLPGIKSFRYFTMPHRVKKSDSYKAPSTKHIRLFKPGKPIAIEAVTNQQTMTCRLPRIFANVKNFDTNHRLF